MKINKSFTKIILGLLLTCLLTLGVSGRLVSVSALAVQELPEQIAPVFDTEIIQFKNYAETLSDPQLDILYFLTGALVASQVGASEYQLVDPYTTRDGAIGFLKSLGLTAYNQLIGLVPSQDPLTGMDYRPYLKGVVALLMGDAVLAANYDTEEDFYDELNSSDHVFMPFNYENQFGMNTMFGLEHGIFNWQFDTSPFTSDITYRSANLTGIALTDYNNYLSSLDPPIVRQNVVESRQSGTCWSNPECFDVYHNIFINTSSHLINIVDDNGNPFSAYAPSCSILYAFEGKAYYYYKNGHLYYNGIRPNVSYNPSSYSTYVELVRAIYNNEVSFSSNSSYLFLEDFIDHVYVGTMWGERDEIFNVTDLNIAEKDSDEYYLSVPQDTDYYIDIIGLLNRLVNNTDLYDVFINNIYTPEGVLVTDPQLLRVSNEILSIVQESNPPIPVDLNELAVVTDNDYIDKLKEHAEDASNVLGLLVASAHNIDYEFLYIILGTSLFTLICALLGKMGK